METILHIEGMSCDHCVKHLTRALEAVAGVSKAKVSLKEKQARISHGGGVSAGALKAAVSDAGFEAVG